MNEKRAAVGYAPVDIASPDAATEAKAGYDPNQPRVPEGNEDGGQWADGGGGGGPSSSGRVRVAQADTGTRNDSGGEIELAQARGGRVRVGPRAGENWQATPAQEARLAVAHGRAQEAIRRVRKFDPEWRPTPSFVESAEGAIRRAEGEAREAEARFQEVFRDAVPNTNPDWGANRLKDELRDRGYVFRGATKYSPGQKFTDPKTGDEVRIMERPRKPWSTDPLQKHLYDYYYRYKPGQPKNAPWGAHIPIPNKKTGN